MFFEIENTPERIRKARRTDVVKKESPVEPCPRLILAPFSRPPQVVFENVVIGSTCERNLEVLNTSKNVQQITLDRALPPGLSIHLPSEWPVLEPETCYCLKMQWSPTQPTALRETIRFTNDNRGRYDVIVVLKSTMNVKGKGQVKGFKISPGKRKKKQSKRSPVAIYKKSAEVINNTTKIKKTFSMVQQSTQHEMRKTSNKENISSLYDCSMMSHPNNCPFDSPTSIDFNFDTSEIFSNMRKETENVLQNTYDTSFRSTNDRLTVPVSENILKPSSKFHCNTSDTDIFDNLTFTPLKTMNVKSDKLNKEPRIILSMNSDSELDDSLDVKSTNKENDTHSIMCITSTQPPNKWLSVDHQYQEPSIPNKKIPNTSSPKELNSPNFSINTDFSRISDLSFFPQRFSTEKKMFPKVNNDTQEILDDQNGKLSSDTYTKYSPNTPMDPINQMQAERPPHFSLREQPKMCRQALFTECQQQKETYCRNYLNLYDIWRNDIARPDVKSPPRSLTPPLQSIPEESVQFSDTQVLDKTDNQMSTFTINRTFDKIPKRDSISSTRQSWSKKAIRPEPELWKVSVSLPRKSLKPKGIINTRDSLSNKVSDVFESNKSINQNIPLNQVGNVYSQSFTVDPFLSSTYFYDEEAVDKFEKEFKRWLNCILTPPADLDSNVEQKVDVGKAWIENRNKEVPAAPTKEQVCSKYHNSHRLENLRRSARAMLMSPEISQVFMKLNAQIEKKLIAIRTDRNLHLDVGLQKAIMELLLSYNPLWLRIGLEAIYGLVLPLKSNSDIEGMTTFIIQRMFKNPHLKNKHSKSKSKPNMLLPAYMDAIKKFTLKKFFMLVFFLDQAKQRKLIPHDPCLFCRNAVCRESREVIIGFTRDLIAGIGDITKHLRPLGYVVSHKQSYLDEYKYAVHNIALDLRDGVRLTKVMEIILMKNSLLNQLRTPAISRLQKIHNVQVAMNALKEANFVIDGEITANDIADGHREKTLSLLWQLIHVFRAPLFEKAANVIQTWWKKKYEIIVEKKRQEEKILQKKSDAASAIQCWWRRIQYNRLDEWKMQQITTSTLVIQKYCRMWLCRSRLQKLKACVRKIEDWYISMKMINGAKDTLKKLRSLKEELRRKSATIIQSHVRRWLCMKEYNMKVCKVVLIQSIVRRFLARKQYVELRKSVSYIQQKYRSKLMMKEEMKNFAEKRRSAVIIQSYYRMVKQRKIFQKIKMSVHTIEQRYLALLKMRSERKKYEELKKHTIIIQSRYRGKKTRKEYLRQKQLIMKLQERVRANQAMKRDKENFEQIKSSCITIQKAYRSYVLGKLQRQCFLQKREAALKIQNWFRNCKKGTETRQQYLQSKKACVTIQRTYKAYIIGRNQRREYLKIRTATLRIQTYFRAYIEMKTVREQYIQLKAASVTIQRAYRAYVAGRKQRNVYSRQKSSATRIQVWFRSVILTTKIRSQYLQLRRAVLWTQQRFRANIRAREARKHEAAMKIQMWYRSLQQRNACLSQFRKLKSSVIIIQSVARMYILRKRFLTTKRAAITIQRHYRSYKLSVREREKYIQLKTSITILQSHIRCFIERKRYMTIRSAVITMQTAYRQKRQNYLIKARREAAAICLQTNVRRYLAQSRYQTYIKHITIIQKIWRGKLVTRLFRYEFLHKRRIIVQLQSLIRGYLVRKQVESKKEAMKNIREGLRRQRAASIIQALFRGHKVRMNMDMAGDRRIAHLRQRWRDGALKSTQESLKERNEEAMAVLRNMSDIETVIRAFKSLEILTEVIPMMYNSNAASIVRRVYVYMSVTNRSISSIEVLKSAASVLVNLARYRVTGPKIYARDLIPPILKFMWRFSNSETQLFCILTTYLWLFSKYDGVRDDLTEFLNLPENQKMLATIKGNVDRMKRMASNSRSKFLTPQQSKFVSHTGNSLMNSKKNNCSILLPSLEPDYGIVRADKPRYFEDAQQAITCLFNTYNL